ncbi:hypothetical protein [Candidatus Villigracilis proximus]|uniref:hypothetical protein n=1 Tax=Candidatus Villigracilis proximus TaxID=3140683 RepID=UPI0031EE10BB
MKIYASGSTVDLLSSDGQFLARASYSPTSKSPVSGRSTTSQWIGILSQKIKSTIEMRQKLKVESHSNSYRFLHAESDGIPGLIVDRYNDVLVLQSLTTGSEFWKETIADLLVEETGIQNIYERSTPMCANSKDYNRSSVYCAALFPLSSFPLEYDLKFNVDIQHGTRPSSISIKVLTVTVWVNLQKTVMCSCFCYTGGFSIHALANGAKSVLLCRFIG